ncbi:MAG: hypothetical protein C4523_15280 [Myxococcales bacterium]|nr:MAG: hypothetical protein C4523_15280 [Myxococcales bacterium]
MRAGCWTLLLALFAALAACGEPAAPSTDPGGQTPDAPSSPDVDKSPTGEVCSIGEPNEDAYAVTGYDPETNSAVLVNGQIVTPAGKTIGTERFAWGVALSPDGQYAYVTNAEGQSLQAFDLSGETIVAVADPIRLPTGHGVAVTKDGQTVYVAGASAGVAHIFQWSGETFGKTGEIELYGYVASLALSADDQTLYAILSTQSALAKIPLPAGEPTKTQVGYYPYDVILDADGQTAYVSNWGGDSVSVVNTATMAVTAEVAVERHPEGMALAENDAYLVVANSDDDSLSVIDTATNGVTQTIPLDADNPEFLAWTPNAVAAHPSADAHRAFVASADHNAIEVLDTQNWTLLGSIPTAHYPTRLALSAEGDKIAVVNGKGFGARPGQKSGAGLYGVLQWLDAPADAVALEEYTWQVKQNTERAAGFFPNNECERLVPLPLNDNEKSVIEHVILVIKENKTYDELLGDLVGPEGDEWHDPALTVAWGERVTLEDGEVVNVTPNAHKIARTWVDMVNYYADSEVSLQGHMWATQADCNDYVEKGRFDRLTATGVEPITFAGGGSIFEHLDNHGVNFRNYGEVVNFGPRELAKWIDKIDLKYPYWSTGVTDVTKAREVIREWNLAVETGDERLFPPFIFIVLPNDHTVGGDAGMPKPQTMVADNDHGLGLLLDWLSHSPFWEKSILFAIQDDPQSGFGDHIDAHRSVCYVASPWIKRGYRSTVHYSMPSVFRTIELILDLPPINKNTLLAPPMADIFTDRKDAAVYDAEVPTMPYLYNPEAGQTAQEAKRWNWSTFDGHDGLGDHLYRCIMGDTPRPAYVKRIDD